MRARVLVRPKAGILDPQGIAVERALPALGFQGVQNVHVGRLIELDVEDPEQLDAMCRQLLVNPLIEDYEIMAETSSPHASCLQRTGEETAFHCTSYDCNTAVRFRQGGKSATSRIDPRACRLESTQTRGDRARGDPDEA